MNHEYTPEFVARFWSRVDRKDDQDACWIWLAGKQGMSYGEIWWQQRPYLAHRISYSLAYGPFPGELHVLHSCDNPGCVNPRHLFLGTQQDNMNDREQKGRANHPKGKRLPQCKLSDAQVAEIRQRYAAGNVTQLELATAFAVSEHHIFNIVHFKRRK